MKRNFLGGDYIMTDKELIKAKEILKENHINARPIEFWEGKDYYKVAYTTYAGNFYIKEFGKQMKSTFPGGEIMAIVKQYYVIQNRNGKFFKIDDLSGGYPLFIDDFEHCEKYNSKENANIFLKGKYATELFFKEFNGVSVRKVLITVQ